MPARLETFTRHRQATIQRTISERNARLFEAEADKLAGQKQIKALEAQRNQKRRSLFDAQDQVDRQPRN